MPIKKSKTFVPSDSIKNSISRWEGKAMSEDTIDPLSKKLVKKNNSFEDEAKLFHDAIPENLRDTILNNQKLADNLFSYSYNVGSGRFKERVVPALKHFYETPLGTAQEVVDSMYANGDSILPGLYKRRQPEKKGVMESLPYKEDYLPKPPIEQPDALRVDRPEPYTPIPHTPKPMHPIKENFWKAWSQMPYKAEGGQMSKWKDLNMQQRADLMDIYLDKGITSLNEMISLYDNRE